MHTQYYLSISDYIEQRNKQPLMIEKYFYVNSQANHTWRELRIVNIHANVTVSSFTASNPNNQVSPSSGSKNIAAFTSTLLYQIQLC